MGTTSGPATPIERDRTRCLGGRYRLDETIGSGGMGTVYRATDLRLLREVAVKLLDPVWMSDPRAAHRFLREARAMAAVDCSHIVPIYDFGETDGRLFLVMKSVHAENLLYLLQTSGRLPESRALVVVRDVLRGLRHIHERGLVHRDVKSGNILVATNGRAVLLDFGIAWDSADRGITQAGLMMGTPSYISPEQRSDPSSVDPRSDLYSVGVVLYEALTGKLPTLHSSKKRPGQQSELSTSRPSELFAEISPATDAIVSRALCVARDGRFANAPEMEHAVEAALAELALGDRFFEAPSRASPADTLVASAPRARRWWRAALLVTLLMSTAMLVTQYPGVVDRSAGASAVPRRAEIDSSLAGRVDELCRACERWTAQSLAQCL